MRLSDLGEFGLIRHIKKLSHPASPDLLVGIGDDAAALKIGSTKTLLATTDMLLEGVHFDLAYTDFHSLGWKSAAVNVSDIAAMGGLPRFCLSSLGIPPSLTVEQIEDFYRGFAVLLRKTGTVLVGGDTCRSRGALVVCVTVIGEAAKTTMLTRSGARPGHRIFVTGTLGDSAAGLEMLQAKGNGQRAWDRKSEVRGRRTEMRKLIEKHLRPVPRVREGGAIARSRCASAMIDISDGLSSDLSHICEQSGAGAEIDSRSIPLSPALRRLSGILRKPVLDYALAGGEDYELLFTVPPRNVKRLLSLDLPVTEIGVMTRGAGMTLVDKGKKRPLKPVGFDHFGRP